MIVRRIPRRKPENGTDSSADAPRPPWWKRRKIQLLVALAVVVLAVGAWLVWPFWQLSGQFRDHLAHQPSRLYARPTTLVSGQPFRPAEVAEELATLGYREWAEEPLAPGTYLVEEDRLVAHLRRFPTPDGLSGGGHLEVRHNGHRVESLTLGGDAVETAQLEPVLLASYFGDDLQERRPVHVEEVPEELIWAILAAEDEKFFEHGGVSLTGIARAAWANLRGGGISQGGSTLTQQLVKNLYLSHERRFSRKLREATLAVLLEARYEKREILQAYVNEVYLGVSNGVNLMGVGSASRAYFGKEVGELTLDEAATLAGMLPSPARYMPTAHPEASKERRDWVLGRMVDVGYLDAERAEAARERPFSVHPQPVVRRRAPYFADHVAAEAAARYGVEALDGSGYQLLSTLDWRDQQVAQETVRWGVEALEDGWEKGRGEGVSLQSAVVSIDPRSGGIRAYVGGRDYGGSQFDRAGSAMRQAGSAFKPVIYAAAFENGVSYPAAFVQDEPLTVRQAGSQPWSPQNSDGQFHGWVSVRTAVEDSLNVATARVALQTGLDNVVEVARGLGIETPLEPVPSIALGAFEVTPLQLATVYATFAAGGERPPVHALDAVLDQAGRAVDGADLPPPERVVSAETAYLVTSVLQGVIDRGTGAGARNQGVRGPLAGKTGTTNDRRDSWFAGYSPDRATTVWVGYDDN
ncbi:MAG TPA: PBP1A family penicillin-binding protein, partial [Thermoanaerobaculia bacterium]|nr:PBP1A family penicillin-binding protein [Thermoanaerobaculia bacterium]